jgi:hypothetical protein
MDNWLERVKKSIFPRSVETQDIRKALAEWFYTGETYDLEFPSEDCELCGHPEIRYQFTICNRHTANELQIGSECITRFEIPAIDEKGVSLSSKETRKVVAKDRRKLITDAKERRMVQTLIELKREENAFSIDSFITYYKERGAFTPKQLAFLLWRLKVNAIEFRPSDFKLTIRRDREKEQLLSLEDFKIEAIWPCLSTSQRNFFQKKRN